MTRQSRNIGETNRIEWHRVTAESAKNSRRRAKICYSIINNIKNIKYIYIIILLNVTVRELSSVMAFCRFCRFLIYISVRFIYISVTLSFFFSCLLKTTPMPFYPAILAIRGKSLILNGFFLPKRLPKLAANATKTLSP